MGQWVADDHHSVGYKIPIPLIHEAKATDLVLHRSCVKSYVSYHVDFATMIWGVSTLACALHIQLSWHEREHDRGCPSSRQEHGQESESWIDFMTLWSNQNQWWIYAALHLTLDEILSHPFRRHLQQQRWLQLIRYSFSSLLEVDSGKIVHKNVHSCDSFGRDGLVEGSPLPLDH